MAVGSPQLLVPVRALSVLFRAKFRDALKGRRSLTRFRGGVATLGRSLSAGRRRPAALRYLAPYIFRVAISNRRILSWPMARSPFAIVLPIPARHDLHPDGDRIHPPLLAARLAQRLCQSALLWLFLPWSALPVTIDSTTVVASSVSAGLGSGNELVTTADTFCLLSQLWSANEPSSAYLAS